MNDLTVKNAYGLEFLVRLMDVMALWIAAQFVTRLYFQTAIDIIAPIHTILLYFCCGLAFFIFPQFGLYTSWRGRKMPSMCASFTAAWAIILLTGLFFSFLIHRVGELSRLWLSYWYIAGIVFLAAYRILVYSTLHLLRTKGFNNKRVVIIGYGPVGQEMHRRAMQQDWYGYEVKAIHSSDPDIDHLSHDTSIFKIKSLKEVQDYVAENAVHEIWITLPMQASAQLQELEYLLRNALVDIRWVPDMMGMRMLSNKVIEFLGMPAVDLNQPISSGIGGIFKNLFDKIFSIAALTLLAPLMIAIAIAVKLSSPGPVFFRQDRLGLNGKKFRIFKFRTMKVHHEDGDKVTQATQDDPRTTPTGRFLRRTSLDELPQFFNVLFGDMSVVGPRPHALQHNDMYKDILDFYMLRHRVKPGITGWAQIHGLRGETDTIEKMNKRVKFDLQYIQNWSLWLDLRIILWTAFKGWTSKHAY